MKKLFLIVSLGYTSFILSGCVNFNTELRNRYTGKTLTCSSLGAGLSQSIMAKLEYDQCMKKAQLAGYKED